MNEMVMGTCILFGVLIVLMAFRFPISFCLARALKQLISGYRRISAHPVYESIPENVNRYYKLYFHVCAVLHYHGTDHDRRRYRRQTDGIL